MTSSFQCPSCGSSIEFDAKYARVISCKYCQTVLEFGTGELTIVWQQSEFIDFPSIFTVGSTTQYSGKDIFVHGLIRYKYDWWFFDVFFVEIDGKKLFIQEDDGTINFFQESDWIDAPFELDLSMIGKTLVVDGDNYFIQEVWVLKVVNIKGSIDSFFVPNKEYEYYDGSTKGNQIFIKRNPETKKIRVGNEVNILS